MTETEEIIKQQITENMILLYMKGTPQLPQCGFSAQVVNALQGCGVTDFAFINVLEDPAIRATLPHYAKWPTFPQLYIQGELIGGCDIVLAMHEQGELKKKIEQINEE